MVYLLCRMVGDVGPPKMLNLESSDASGRQVFVQAALAAFSSFRGWDGKYSASHNHSESDAKIETIDSNS